MEGAVDVTNATFEEAKTALKRIVVHMPLLRMKSGV
jgi:putative NIF3 family GTP cyclohydrolase 1 type 2